MLGRHWLEIFMKCIEIGEETLVFEFDMQNYSSFSVAFQLNHKNQINVIERQCHAGYFFIYRDIENLEFVPKAQKSNNEY